MIKNYARLTHLPADNKNVPGLLLLFSVFCLIQKLPLVPNKMPNSSRNSCKSSETLKERKHRRRESDSSLRDVRSNRCEAVETTAIKCNKSSRKNVSEEKSVENKADFLFLKWSELFNPTASRCDF